MAGWPGHRAGLPKHKYTLRSQLRSQLCRVCERNKHKQIWPHYQHTVEKKKKIIPTAVLNSITLPENANTFIPPTPRSPPRRELTSAALGPSLHGASQQEGKQSPAERGKRKPHSCVPTQPCPASPVSPQPWSASPHQAQAGGQHAKEKLQDGVES